MESSSSVTLDSTLKLKDSSNKFRCCRGTISISNGIRVVLIVGVLAVVTILSLQVMYFRRSIFLLMVPVSVILLSLFAIVRQLHHFVWPIIAISCFHIFIALYAGIIFLFYYIFKPLYIIMVLNWAFDTLYTQKTPSYYVQCAVIFASIVAFGAFNVWQLSIAVAYKAFLRHNELAAADTTPSVSLVVNVNDDRLAQCPALDEKPSFH